MFISYIHNNSWVKPTSEKKRSMRKVRSRQTTYMDGSFEFSSFNGRLVVYASFKGHSLVGIHTFSSKIDNTYKKEKEKSQTFFLGQANLSIPVYLPHTHTHQTTPLGPVLVSQFSLSNETVTTKKQTSLFFFFFFLLRRKKQLSM